VLGRVLARAEVAPSSLVLPRRVEGKEVYSAECLCRGVTGKPLTLRVVSVPDGWSVRLTPVPGIMECQRIRIEYSGSAQSGLSHQKNFVVKLSASTGGADIAVQVEIRVVPAIRGHDHEKVAARRSISL